MTIYRAWLAAITPHRKRPTNGVGRMKMEIEFKIKTRRGVVALYQNATLSEDGIRDMMLSVIPPEVRGAIARQERLAMEAIEAGMATETMLKEMKECSLIASKCIFDAGWLASQARRADEWLEALLGCPKGFNVRSTDETRAFSLRIVG